MTDVGFAGMLSGQWRQWWFPWFSGPRGERPRLARRVFRIFGLIAVSAVSLAPTFARADDGISILQRMAQATQQLSYSGIFVYQNGKRMETSRITHVTLDGSDRERIEVLDGSPREMLRNGEEIQSFLPDENRLIVETRSIRQRFPALVPAGLASLPDHYRIRRNGYGRVAGIDSRVLILEPRDDLRYGRQFWIDMNSGLLLRSRIVNPQGDTLESFSFTQLNIGDPSDADALKPGFDRNQVRVQRITATETTPETQGWVFQNTVPGFRRIVALKREADDGRPASLQVFFSDGVASMSAFIEPRPAAKGEATVLTSMGSVSVYHRQVRDHMVVVMGEVPALAVKQLGDGVAWKGQ